MAGRRTPAAPTGLGPRGRRFWHDVHSAYDLERDETELLVECCRLLDQVEDLQAILNRDGLTVRGSTGQTRVHPAVGELRASRQTLGRLLAQLDLPDEGGATLATPHQARARTAARSRWAKTETIRELRRHGPPAGA